MSDVNARGKWSFGISWIVICVFCWVMLEFFGEAYSWVAWQAYEQTGYSLLYRLLQPEDVRLFLAGLLCGFIVGVLIGGLQQILLYRRFKINRLNWVVATTIGLILYFFVTMIPTYFQTYL